MQIFRSDADGVIINLTSEDFVKTHMNILQRLAQRDRRVYSLFLAGQWDELERMICEDTGIYDR